MPKVDEVQRPSWQTIDYIGGGYVLQTRMQVTVEKRYIKSFRKDAMDFSNATVKEVSPAYELDVDVRKSQYGDSGTVNDVYQPHRIVHVSELQGIDMTDLVEKFEQ